MPDQRVGYPRVTEQSAMFTKNIQLAWLSRISIAVTSGRINQNYGSIYSIGRNWPSRHKRMSDETSYIPSPHRCYTATIGSQPVIVSVLRHQGLRRCIAALEICSPAAHTCMGPSYLSLPVSHPSRTPTNFKRRTPPGKPRTAYPRDGGRYLSLSDSSTNSILSTSIDLRPRPFSTGCANLAPLCQTGGLLQDQLDI